MENSPDLFVPKVSRSFFVKAILFESSLLIVAVPLTWIFKIPLFANFDWTWQAAFLGLTSTIPMLAFLGLMLKSRHLPLVEFRLFLERFIPALFGKGSLWQLALLSLAAGIGEEVLFRGVLQIGVEGITSPFIGVFVASLIFAACHALSRIYFFATLVIGFYLSFIWEISGNLLCPIIAHAVYDFIVLLYFLRWKKPETRSKESN